MGSGGGVPNPTPSHNYWGETYYTYGPMNAARMHMNYSNDSLNNIYKDLNKARDELQKQAFADEMRNQWQINAVEWAIYEKQVSVNQAKYVSTVYINRILGELRNLQSYVS